VRSSRPGNASRRTNTGRADGKGRLMRNVFRAALAVAVAAAAFSALAGTAGAKNGTTCNGELAAGSYGRVVVPAGAVCFSDGPISVNGGVYVESGATFVLGSEESTNTGTINGGVHAIDAMNVQIHFARINGGIDIHGGSGPFGAPFGVTWNTIEDSHINGGATIEGYNGFWMGFIRNNVNGSVNLNNNVLVDPDGNEFVTNTIHGSLNCTGNSPAPQIGDSEGAPNQVTGAKTGQCAVV
jgi:hypothetical protein